MRRKRKGDEFTREQAAKEILAVRVAGVEAGTTTPLSTPDYMKNPHIRLGSDWECAAHKVWADGFREGRDQRRAEIENACHELTESEEA
jgi:hypothetical protein